MTTRPGRTERGDGAALGPKRISSFWLGPRFVGVLVGALGFVHPGEPALGAEPSAEPPDPYQLLHEVGETLSVVESEYVEPVSSAELIEGALRGMVGELDPHSSYFSRAELRSFEEDTSGRFGGIGVEIGFDGKQIVVIAPVDGSPAERAGLEPFDVILKVNGTAVDDVVGPQMIRALRGPIGSTLTLTVQKKKSGEVLDLTLVREEIRVASVRAVSLDGGVLYLRIKSFQSGTHRELLDAFDRHLEEGHALSGVILDLRNNPGGLVREAVGVADEFLDAGLIYSTRHRGRVLRSSSASGGGMFVRGPVSVLVNEYSASAAELVAGALKDHRRAIVVGARSFGKGSVQTLLPLAYGAALKLTTALYYTPSGNTLQARGVEPDVIVDPGYVVDSPYRIVRESDLAGHLDPGGMRLAPSSSGNSHAVPPTDDDLHLGVARVVPKNPRASRDLALAQAYAIALGERAKK